MQRIVSMLGACGLREETYEDQCDEVKTSEVKTRKIREM